MAREDFRCAHQLRVRWAEVDMQKVVFNAHYLTYLDTALAEYWREIGLAYPEGYVDRYGADMFLRQSTVEYLGSAHYDDRLSVLCRVASLGRSSMTMRFEVWRDEPADASPLVTADLVYVNVSVASMRAEALPEDLRERVRAYERLTIVPHEGS
jgi:acyl-CoA thioester hydrolase